MKRAKKPKSKTVQISAKKMQRIKEQITEETTGKAIILSVAAMADELGLKEKQIVAVAIRINRYATYLDEHILKINEMAEIIEKQTGIRFSRF